MIHNGPFVSVWDAFSLGLTFIGGVFRFGGKMGFPEIQQCRDRPGSFSGNMVKSLLICKGFANGDNNNEILVSVAVSPGNREATE